MKKTLFLRLPAIMLVYGIMFVGCEHSSTNNLKTDPLLNGAWITSVKGIEMQFKFNNGYIEISMNSELFEKGTYSTNENKLIVNFTHIYGHNTLVIRTGLNLESKWYTISDFYNKLKTYCINNGMSEESWSENIEPIMQQSVQESSTCTYLVSGNTLTMDLTEYGQENEPVIFTKR